MKDESARIKATETAAPNPSPDATGMVEVMLISSPSPLPLSEMEREAERGTKLMNNGSNWMVGRKRTKFGVQVHIRGVDPDACAG